MEHSVDISLMCEVWQKAEDKKHLFEVEKMLQIDGLNYFSTTRPPGKRGGGAAIIVNTKNFTAVKLDVQIPNHLEVVWALAKPKSEHAHIKRIILCSFYSPPRSKLRNKLLDHIICTLQSLTTRYPGCGILVGGDKNKMNISSLLNNNLKLKPLVRYPTRKREILDILLTNLYPYYNNAVIIPPVQPDIPGQGVPSDHSVPLCIPHTDPHNPPTRRYKTVVSRPLPDSKIREFGQWLTSEKWEEMKEGDSPCKQVEIFERRINEKVEEYFPQKKVKVGCDDKVFMTSELKSLKRKRMREYKKHGKSSKYLTLAKEFQTKYKKAAQNYIRKNVDSLKDADPGKAYSILKRMGAQPGDDFDEMNSFTLPQHENISVSEAAELISEHFSKISREFSPVSIKALPDRVIHKIENPESESLIPEIFEHDVFRRICQAHKPKSGVPGDLPRKLVAEFGPEIAVPVTKIFSSVMESARQGTAKWPPTWKQEFGVPLQKISNPQSEDDLRVISLTSFFSKVLERFVLEWLMTYVGKNLDPKQFGGLKGNSISHYLIEMINFILYNQDYNLPIAILACTIDFSKAFNRIDHNLLVTKLSDLGVPGWLLNLVMGFLTERSLLLKYKGETSKSKPLPGGGPQGTLLGLFLFLILINDCGFQTKQEPIGATITKQKSKFTSRTLHTKFVDDMTVLEALNLNETTIKNPDRPLPDPFHARLGQKLDPTKSQVYSQVSEIQRFARDNKMKLNLEKCKFMLFNPTTNFDFIPELEAEGKSIETVEKMKLLGLIITNDLKWRANTEQMVKKAYNRLWIIKRLKAHGASFEDLVDVYNKQIRSILEFGVPVWNPSLTKEDSCEIERVQKAFLHILLGNDYLDYENALRKTNLEKLKDRRVSLCRTFAKKSLKHPKHKHWFQPSKGAPNTRSVKPTLREPLSRLARYKKSPIPYLTRLLNES